MPGGLSAIPAERTPLIAPCGKAKKRNGRKKLVRTPLNAQALFTAQNGDTLTQSVPIAAQCSKAKGKKRSAHKTHHD